MTRTGRSVAIRAGTGDAHVRLFCLPYAGGSATAYTRWKAKVPASVELCAIDMPGHGSRLHQPLTDDIGALVAARSTDLGDEVGRPFALFGHSLGALLGFELAHELSNRYGIEPSWLFASAHRAPQLAAQTHLHRLPDADLISALRRLDGAAGPTLDSAEPMAIMLPVIRADLMLSECYQYTERPPLTCPITVFGGRADVIAPPNQLPAWARHTRAFARHDIDRGHWFLYHPRLIEAVFDELGPLAIPAGRG